MTVVVEGWYKSCWFNSVGNFSNWLVNPFSSCFSDIVIEEVCSGLSVGIDVGIAEVEADIGKKL